MRIPGFILFIFFIAFQWANAQAPVSQVFLFDVQVLPTGQYGIYHPKLLTGFNPLGYNNQPYFISDNELVFTSMIPPATQTDIILLNINNLTRQQVTNTAWSEYSPTLMHDKNHISVVRVDEPADANHPNAVQRLYSYELKPQGKITSILPEMKNIGYHTWLDDKNVALFLVNKPNQLALVDITTRDPLVFTSDIGRCITGDDRGHLIYVHKITDKDWFIKDYDPVLQRASILAETVKGSEDFVLLPGGNILMGSGTKLFAISPATQKTWTEVADLKFYGIQAITRMSFRNNRLVLVNQSR
ncbi:MAG: hypothetical protein ABI761_17135 [Saprospiraceae bacterium]